MIAYSDHIAAEHLQVHTRDAHATAAKLRNYGSLFIGTNASVVYSDKCAGPTTRYRPWLRDDIQAVCGSDPISRRARINGSTSRGRQRSRHCSAPEWPRGSWKVIAVPPCCVWTAELSSKDLLACRDVTDLRKRSWPAYCPCVRLLPFRLPNLKDIERLCASFKLLPMTASTPSTWMIPSPPTDRARGRPPTHDENPFNAWAWI